MGMIRFLCLLLMMFVSVGLRATEAQPSNLECIVTQYQSGGANQTLADVRSICDGQGEQDYLPERFRQEQATQDQSYVITPHRQNYILPVTYNDRPNQAPFVAEAVFPDSVKPVKEEEAKLQLSFKIPLNYDDLLVKHDGLYFGFTLKSFWQVYNANTSRPFRETNYRPEIFYQAPLPVQAWEGAFFTRVGFEHESNGRSQLLSRSWNRLYAGVGFTRDNWVVYLQPWYRLPEDEKEDDGDPMTPPSPTGDDNPDIHKFLGHYELNAVWKHDNIEVSSQFRQNFNTGNGSVELGVSFPLWGRLKGYVQYYNGYGESMIDYDHRVNRIGMGFLLTDLL